MPRIFFPLTILLATAFAAGAQARFLSEEHDFGAFNEDDGKVSTAFTFVNEGDTPLRIISVRSSCGCTVPEYSHADILPGDSSAVEAIYNPTGRPGRFSKSLQVRFSNDSVVRLHIKGVVIGAQNTLRSRYPIEAGPVRMRGNVVTFGAVPMGRMKSEFFEVYNASTSPVVPRWSGIPAGVRITAAHDTIPPGQQGIYSMVFSPGKSTPYGLFTDSATIHIPGAEDQSVSFAAIVEEDFSRLTDKQRQEAPVIAVSQEILDFGDFTSGMAPIKRSFTITNRGKSPLILRRIYSADPAISVSYKSDTVKKGKSATVTVTFDPSKLPADAGDGALTSTPVMLNGRLQIIANDPDHSLTTIRLSALPL